MRKVSIIWVSLLFIMFACGKEDDSVEIEEKLLPEEFVNKFMEGEYELIYAQTSDELQSIITLEQFVELGKDFNQGVEAFELDLALHELGEYQWISNEGDRGIWTSFSDDNTITGIQFIPIQTFPEQDETFTKTEYRMPINEEWFVYWGGTNVLNNYHYSLLEQRYAYDLIIVKDGASFVGEPTKNENYFAFGKDVVAPADGVVVSIVNELEDNQPGVETDTLNPLGNHVVMKHDHNEYSIIAHFKKGSIVVSEGEAVIAGDLLGQVGNSGNSSEPHIHFQVSDGEEFQSSKSIRILFEGNKSPVRGETVQGF